MGMSSTTRRVGVALVSVVLLATQTVSHAADEPGAGVAGTNDAVVGQEPQVTPAELGDGGLDGLQYADPAEQVEVIQPPEPIPHGSAELTHPLDVPAGRAGVEPDLALNYSSGGDNGWVGVGWDLSVGAVEVDTRWGVPRFLEDDESETYILDGEVLSPTAVRSDFAARVPARDDWTRRIETQYENIIRHGNRPSEYWWEVQDKLGGFRYYGGTPEGGRDPAAILTDGDGTTGNGYRWALSAEVDISGNTIVYEYRKVTGRNVGDEKTSAGRQMYLDRIVYTGSIADVPDDAAYEVRFVRDSEMSPQPPSRDDVLIDASGGFLEVTSDLLRRVEVYYGQPTADGSPRSTRDQLVKAFGLNYDLSAAFEKTVLTSVDQIDADGNVYATHDFDYYDDVRDGSGNYTGFDAAADWEPGDNNLTQPLLGPVETSVLGASETNSGDVHAYLGFNPLNPTKNISFGGALTISGGATESLAEFIDINGDLLPDKVFRRNIAGPVQFNLNESGPDGNTQFGDTHTIGGLSGLSTDWNIGVAGGAEAHAGLSVQFSVAADVNIGEDYFTDANTDGLPDFVSGGRVLFNHLDEDGIPTFTSDSSSTAVPIDTGTFDLSALEDLEKLNELEEMQRSQSPLQDTVRRWIAPFTGTISVDAPVTFEPEVGAGEIPDDELASSEDGVRVAIQHQHNELWSSVLDSSGAAATPTGVDEISVIKGDAVYFRVGPVDEGTGDQVRWDPTITYLSYALPPNDPDDAPADVNDLDQSAFDASDDFTLAGRPGTKVLLPLEGTVHVDALLNKSAVTTDDVRVVVQHNETVVFDQIVAHDFVGDVEVETDVAAAAPTDTDDDDVVDQVDELSVRLEIDSPIDISAVTWDPRIWYTEAFSGGEAVPTEDPRSPGEPLLVLDVPVDIDIYPNNILVSPSEPWIAPETRTVDVSGEISAFLGGGDDALPPSVLTEVALTIKQRDELVGKDRFGTDGQATIEDVQLVKGEEYWFDISVRDPNLPERLTQADVTMTWEENGGQMEARAPRNVHWAGRQGIFPVSYRGWGYAGYNGDGDRATEPIDPAAFVIDTDELPDDEPEGFEDEDYNDPSKGESYPFTPYMLEVTDGVCGTGTVPVWRGYKDNIVGGAGCMRASRNATEDPGASSGLAAVGGGARAVRRVGVTAPTASINASIGPLGASAGIGPSFGLLDYSDMNGDGFPDIVAPDYIAYTGPRGGYLDDGGGVSVVGQDLTYKLGAGFNGSPVAISGNSKGDANTSQDTGDSSGTSGRPTSGAAAGNGEQASGNKFGANIGLSLDFSTGWTNPNLSEAGIPDEFAEVPGADSVDFERELADVNGDGLPDEVSMRVDGVYARFNTGYGFGDEVKWSVGGFESGEEYSGSVGAPLGFNWNKSEFAGGLSLNESVDMPRYSWVDVDGDGVLDRLRKTLSGEIKVAWGSGSGLSGEVDYGTFADAAFDLEFAEIPVGEAIAFDRSRGLGAGADFTIGIGPLCIGGCYIIINPGAHFEHSISTTQVQLTDVDGDGYTDSVRSDSDGHLEVRRNRRGRTNLLRSVSNPLGGEIRLDYQRSGNTVEQPYPIWEMTAVEVDDNRPGDGPDVQLTTYEYSGAVFNALEREQLGNDRVIERQREFQDDGDVYDDPVRRTYDRTYLNGNYFEAGLQTSETLLDADGNAVKATLSEWTMIDLADHAEIDLDAAAGPAGLGLLDLAIGPLQTRVTQRWFDDAGAVGQETWNTFSYDDRGNVIEQVDIGEPETPSDDLLAVVVYPDCSGITAVSVPGEITVYDHDGDVLRHRDGSTDICVNGAVTHLEEFLAGDTEAAVTDLDFDDWGNYNRIEYAPNADGDRYTVEYVYDADRHTDIAEVTDSHGLTATATFDGPTGLITSRTDANGHTTSYAYDSVGRLASITGPYEQGTGNPTVAFAYAPTDEDYAYATAHHYDAFNPGDTIDTVRFLDGMGRETQTKHDATVFIGPGSPAADKMVVAGAVEFDALGRPVKEWYPITEDLGTIGTYNTNTAPTDPFRTSFTTTDLVTEVIAPDGSKTTTAYGYGGSADFGAGLFETSVEDAEGKTIRSFTDVRDNVIAIDDAPDGAPVARTRYHYDPLGQLTGVVDSAGNVTTHAYDLLGRRTATQTPDAGLVELQWDLAGNLVAQVDENLRAAGQQISFDHDFDRLVGIDYPPDTPDVAYTYGGPDAPGNGAGRVIGLEDGARIQSFTYDPLGAVTSEIATMKAHNLNPETEARLTYTTEFTYDGFGRLATLTYPDGEVVTHDYDSGGLLNSVQGQKDGFDYPYVDRREYDEFLVPTFLSLGNGAETEHSYDAETRRLSRTRTQTPEREVQDWNYTYDLVGNLLKADNQVPAPRPDLMVGPSTQTYTYDPYYRLIGAEGTFSFAPRKKRDYTFETAYDDHGNIVTKNQTDTIFNQPNNGIPQHPTTYSLNLQYEPDRPHVLTQVNNRDYSADANGQFVLWDDLTTGQNRSATWDATNQLRSVADQGSTTRYTNDESGQLAIERGPEGETLFVNRWYKVRNGAVPWKDIWAGDDRIGVKRGFGPCPPPVEGEVPPVDCGFEHMGYFLHVDAQGSTNVVTGADGLVFEHMLYFPSGEIWVQEHSTIHRTTYLYGGGHLDEFRSLINFGQRWYEPREQFWYSPDPVLVEDPFEVIEDPSLLPAYTYAGANPLRFGDTDGRAPNWVQARPSIPLTAPAWQRASPSVSVRASHTSGPQIGMQRQLSRASRLWKALTHFPQTQQAKSLKAFADRFEAKPLVEFNVVKTGDGWGLESVKVSPTFGFKQFTAKEGKAAAATNQNDSKSTQPGGAQPGSTAPSPAAAGPSPTATGGSGAGNVTPPGSGPTLGTHRGSDPVAPSGAP